MARIDVVPGVAHPGYVTVTPMGWAFEVRSPVEQVAIPEHVSCDVTSDIVSVPASATESVNEPATTAPPFEVVPAKLKVVEPVDPVQENAVPEHVYVTAGSEIVTVSGALLRTNVTEPVDWLMSASMFPETDPPNPVPLPCQVPTKNTGPADWQMGMFP